MTTPNENKKEPHQPIYSWDSPEGEAWLKARREEALATYRNHKPPKRRIEWIGEK